MATRAAVTGPGSCLRKLRRSRNSKWRWWSSPRAGAYRVLSRTPRRPQFAVKVAGEVAFSALSSIFGHHGGGGFFGGGGGGYYSPGSETIINNYYEDGQRGESGSLGRDRDLDSSGLSPDLEDRRFAGDDSGTDDSKMTDDSTDDNSTDDSGDGDGGFKRR